MNGAPRFWSGTKPRRRVLAGILIICALGMSARWALGTAPTVSPPTPEEQAAEQLAEIMVEAREPRFVAPTRRDQIGRIWAPVFINGRGPFRLVLDTGASHSAVTAMVALALGIPTDRSPPVMLRGVTGSATVPTIQVDTLIVGDVRAKAIIDTGGQTTIANLALRNALARRNVGGRRRPDQIVGATMAVEDGEIIATPAIELGSIKIVDPGVTFADLYIFKQWRLTLEPAILIGMDALGTLDTLIIDYREHELQMRLTKSG